MKEVGNKSIFGIISKEDGTLKTLDVIESSGFNIDDEMPKEEIDNNYSLSFNVIGNDNLLYNLFIKDYFRTSYMRYINKKLGIE